MTDKAGQRPDHEPEVPGCTDVELVRAGIPRTYRCRRQGTGEPVTALVYPVRVDSTTAAAFTEQVAALGGIRHPHVAPVLDSGLAGGYPYVISTPDAGTLAEQIHGRSRSAAELAVLGRGVAAGLAALHAAGLVHGSLTPDTVVFAPDGTPLLSGLTLGLGQHTGHAALSSPRQLYLAPETLRDGTSTASSDLYALGAVLYTTGSGKPPLAARMGETAGEHILRVLHEPPARLDTLPGPFADVVARLLEKDPANRPQGAEAVLTALGAFRPEPAPAASPAGGLPGPAVRPVPATPPAEPAESPASPAGKPPIPLPRPALMNRGRLRSWPTPPPAPPNGAPPNGAPPNGAPPNGAPPKGAPAQEQPHEQATPQPDQPQPDPAFAAGAQPGPHFGPQFQSGPGAENHTGTHTEAPPYGPGAEPPHGEGPPPNTGTGPEPERDLWWLRSWLLVSVSAAVAAALIAVLALVSRQDQPEPPPASAQQQQQQRQPSPTPTPSTATVRLNPPADHDTYVDLSWSGTPGLNYALVVAQVGKPADLKLVYKRTKYRVPVVPGVQYCFAVQGTDGINTFETEPRPIRDAQCE
ncbi:serine/threonine protein kinase [Flindersiella endophytica]